LQAGEKPAAAIPITTSCKTGIFDIAGPNPTAEERKEIDRAYMGFLDAQRREAVSAELAKRQNEQLRADLESARHPSEVRSSPDGGSAGITVAGPFGADTVAKVENRTTLKISRKPMFRRFYRSNAR
jgi:hypothetical protein